MFREIHRALVFITTLLGIITVLTGVSLVLHLEIARPLHAVIAPLFGLSFLIQMTTGLLLYFPSLFSLKPKLLRKETVASGTMAFYFTKPLGYKFQAGQYADWTIDGLTHTFSLANAPFEKELMLATRMRDSEFKNRLRRLRPGEEINISPAAGSFVLDRSGSPLIFFAGGIGITPFYSMLKQAKYERLSMKITLIYSNRTREEAAFFNDLDAINVFTKKEGHLTWDKIKKIVNLGAKPIFYLAGPPGFVSGIKKTLKDHGVNGKDIRAEEFSGY